MTHAERDQLVYRQWVSVGIISARPRFDSEHHTCDAFAVAPS